MLHGREKEDDPPLTNSSHQQFEQTAGLIAAPEGVGDGGGPVRLGVVALEADVLVAVVLDLVAGRVMVTVGIPLLTLLLLLVAVRVRVGRRVRVRAGTVVLALLVLLVLLVLALVVTALVVLLRVEVGLALVSVLALDLDVGLLLLSLVLLLLKLVTLGFELVLLVLESLPLSGGGALSLLLALFLLLIIVDELVGQKSSSNGQETSKGGSSDIGGHLLVGKGLDTLLMLDRDVRGALDRLAGRVDRGSVLARDVVGNQGQVNLALGLAAGGVDIKDTVERAARSVDDLVDGDGGKGDDGVGGGLLVHNLDIELGFAGENKREGLVPGGGLARILVDKSLLERFGVVEVGREPNIGILLADGLDILEVLGTVGGDGQGRLALHHFCCCVVGGGGV